MCHILFAYFAPVFSFSVLLPQLFYCTEHKHQLGTNFCPFLGINMNNGKQDEEATTWIS